MPRKRTTKSIPVAEGDVVEKGKGKKPSSSTPKKARDEIEEIFAAKKRKKPEPNREKPKKPVKDVGALNSKSKKNKRKNIAERENGSGFGDPAAAARPRKRTGEGLAIYSEEELGIGRADTGVIPSRSTSPTVHSVCDSNDYLECFENYFKSNTQDKYGPPATMAALNALGDAVPLDKRAKVLAKFVENEDYRAIFIISPPSDRLALVMYLD